ncbi:MAG TPA: hypothetical protein VF666_13560 [Pyrinomonadaceae bacterium]|jgi:tetratricopeptide (TPR) repeat protein
MRHKRALKNARMPSTARYMFAAILLAGAVFGALWWILSTNGDEAPLLPSAVTGGIVLLIAAAAREVVMRRAWTRYALEMEMGSEDPSLRIKSRVGRSSSNTTGRSGTVYSSGSSSSSGGSSRSKTASVSASAAALRALHQRLAEAEAAGAQQPAAHLEAYGLCERYLANTEEAIRSNKAAPDARMALRAGQERVRELQKHHLLSWARGEAKNLLHEAGRRERMSDKIETAQRAVDVINEALKIYPGEPELRASATALRDFMASVKIGHWVELAERAAFRGRYARAIARYRDALFFVSRADMSDEARADAATRIGREIELLRARLATRERPVKPSAAHDAPARRDVRATEAAETSASARTAASARGDVESETTFSMNDAATVADDDGGASPSSGGANGGSDRSSSGV